MHSEVSIRNEANSEPARGPVSHRQPPVAALGAAVACSSVVGLFLGDVPGAGPRLGYVRGFSCDRAFLDFTVVLVTRVSNRVQIKSLQLGLASATNEGHQAGKLTL
jgi:hypothetical protein